MALRAQKRAEKKRPMTSRTARVRLMPMTRGRAEGRTTSAPESGADSTTVLCWRRSSESGGLEFLEVMF